MMKTGKKKHLLNRSLIIFCCRGALPRLDCISKENWSKQRNNVNMQNSAVAAVDSIR